MSLQVGEWQIRVQPNTIVGQLGTMHVETTRSSTFETLPIEIDAEWALPSVEPSEIQTLQVTVNQGNSFLLVGKRLQLNHEC